MHEMVAFFDYERKEYTRHVETLPKEDFFSLIIHIVTPKLHTWII